MPDHLPLPHLVLPGPNENIAYTSAQQGRGDAIIPSRNRAEHAEYLQNRLAQAWSESENAFVASHAERYGVYLEFCSQAGCDLVTKSLEDLQSKQVRLCNIRTENKLMRNTTTGDVEEKEVIYATVFVANEKRSFFLDKILKYATEESKSGKPKNSDLINSIEDLRMALLVSFWQDATSSIPNEKPQWCEVWLSSEITDVELRFVNLLDRLGIVYRQGKIQFPERTVKLVYTNRNQLENLILHSDDIAEFRKAKETADFWVEQPNREQTGWIEDLITRTIVDRESLLAICILDTGVNNNHPLLQQILNTIDCHTCNETWSVHDHKGHGTLMAGVAAFGNLQEHLESGIEITIPHILESAKILPPEPARNNPELWGEITAQGISRAEIQAPLRKRVICIAATSEDTRDHGRPSSWSGAIDQLCSGSEDNKKRLIIVSAGNFTSQDIRGIARYPSSQIDDSVHDPAQAWNAVSVGAYTQLTELTDPTYRGFHSIAGANELSPFSTTSRTWDPKWPIKPEVVFEGGNAAVEASGFVSVANDLSLISTYYQPVVRHFESFQMTSAATSLAANFAVQIQARYPHYWPETVRALMIHSAEWPEQLKRQFAQDNSKSELSKVLRACGYGVPDLNRALNCASNSLTLVSQTEIQPYEVAITIKNGKREKKLKT